MSALVSVVVPTHDRPALLARTVGTVLAQRDVDLEVVVVDDGSREPVGGWLAGLGDERVRVVRLDRAGGVARARNAGIDAARGEWTAFLDDDDLWSPDKLAAQVAAVDAGAFGWCCTGGVNVDERLRVIRPDRPPAPGADITRLVLQFNVIPGGGSGVLARTDLVRSLGGFDPRLVHLADWEMWVRLALRAPMASVRRPLVAYVLHPGGRSRDLTDTETDIAYLAEKHAAAMAEHGVEPQWDHWLGYMAQLEARSGGRLTPLRLHVRIFRRYRHWSWLPGAAGIVVWPSAVRFGDARARRRMPPGWADEVDAWLAPLRNGVAESDRAPS